MTEVVRLVGSPNRARIRFLSVGDRERDGCDELVAPDTNEDGYTGYTDRIHVVPRASASGTLLGAAALTVETAVGQGNWYGAAILHDTWQQVVVGGYVRNTREKVAAYPMVAILPGRIVSADHFDGVVYAEDANGPFDLIRARVGATKGLAVGFAYDGTDVPDFAGSVWLLSDPIRGDVELRTRTVDRRYHGDPGDRAHVLHGDVDVDGDGDRDLVIGAFDADRAAGAVALVAEPPVGDHRVWDVATAVLRGTAPGVGFGSALASGDLDGDGFGDVVVSAPFGVDDGVYVFRGPFEAGEERDDDDADWIVRDGGRDAWLGYGVAIADLDGDGRSDLVVGRPEDYYFGTEPGSVGIWYAPSPGARTFDSADQVLRSGAEVADSFGQTLVSGDFDGDGLGDLAIAAEKDQEAGVRTGSVTIWHGAALARIRGRR